MFLLHNSGVRITCFKLKIKKKLLGRKKDIAKEGTKPLLKDAIYDLENNDSRHALSQCRL